MKDELKIYTEQHRESFDQYVLDLDAAWQGIEEGLSKRDENANYFPWRTIVKIAAVFLVVMMVGGGYFVNNMRSNYDENGISLHNISSELADTEAYYSSKINEKLDLIKASSALVGTEIQAQLESLDKEYQSLKNDLKDNADSEEVINAMIKNYRLKLQMLEKILDEIQKNTENIDYEEVQAI